MPTITFFNLNAFSTPTFQQEGVTITGSGNVVGGSTPFPGGRSGTNLGINNGAIDPGELIDFSFDAGAASGVSYGFASASDLDRDSLFGEGNLEAFDVSGNSLGVLSSNTLNGNISSLFGNQLISRFRLTQSEPLSIRTLTFTSVPVLAAVNDAPTTTEDAAITFNVRDNDTFLLSGSPTLSFDTTGLQGSLTNNGNGSFTYNPGSAFQALNTGQTATTSFQYTLTSGSRSSTATVTFTITGLDDNQPPTAVNFSNTTTALAENTSTATRIKVADITVTDDGLGTNNLSLTGTDAAAFELDGSVLYLRAGTVLDSETKTSYSVTVNADDPTLGTSPDTSRVFTLSVTDVNEAPSATGKTVSTSQNTAVTVDLSDNLSDPDANGLTGATLNVTSSTGGTTSIDQNTRQVTFTPTTDFSGTASFQYTLTDAGGLASNVATVTVAVAPTPTPPDGELGTALLPIRFKGGQKGLRRKGTNRNDTLRGSSKNDILLGLGGNDRLLSGSQNRRFGEDRLLGGAGNDLLVSGAGNDRLDGGSGNDRLKAGRGNDLLLGGSGNDRLQGDEGDDVLVGGAGTDTSRGGAGRDTFVFNAVTEGSDVIEDFEGTADLIDLRSIFAQAAFSGATPFARYRQFIRLEQVGSDTAVTIDADGNGAGSSFTTLVTLSNVALSAVSSKNFVIS